MRVYYNDNEPFVAVWLRNLIAAGHLPAGDVDERPIQDVKPDDLKAYTQCHFFAGIGGWAYALQLAGWDGPVWTGSCPCQPFSAAGQGKAEDDQRHLWPHWFRLIRECQPERIFGEQVSGAIGHGWLDLVSTDLEAEGYAVGACVLGAHSVGAPHQRQRLWFVADALPAGRPERGAESGDGSAPGSGGNGILADAERGPAKRRGHDVGSAPREPESEASERERLRLNPWAGSEFIPCRDGKARPVGATQSGVLLLADGLWYRLATVRTELFAQAMTEVSRYAEEAGCRPEEVLPLVQQAADQEALRGSAGGPWGISSPEVLLTFLRDLLSALHGTADSSRCPEASQQEDYRVLRDLRVCLATHSTPSRRQSEEQQPGQSTDALLALSQFLARCGETGWGVASRTDAAVFPLAAGVKGRVGMLRGMGNSVVSQVAAEFVRAYMDVVAPQEKPELWWNRARLFLARTTELEVR